jgi:putative endonuclease
MQDRKTLVFVEVRYRRGTTYGDSIESITPQKIRKLQKTAEYYLIRHQLYDKIPCRFDVVGVAKNIDTFEFHWLKNII